MLVLLDDKCDKTNTEVKIRPEKNSGLYGIWTHDLCDTNRELVITLVPKKPVKWWIDDCEYENRINYYKGKMAHNNTQQMESYYNTSINHSINVKQSNDVHFVCDSNNRNKLKIINTGLYMMTIFNEYKSTQTRIYNRI